MTLIEEIRGLLAYLRTSDPSVTAANLDTAVIPTIERAYRALSGARGGVTRSQQMALISALVDHARCADRTEVYIDCSVSPPAETTLGDLLRLFEGASAPGPPMTARCDAELLPWIGGVIDGRPTGAGGFLRSLAEAALRADPENYAALREALLQMRSKYPGYHAAEWKLQLRT